MDLYFKNISEEDLDSVAKALDTLVKVFFTKNSRACIIFLEGEMGAGKTTFTKAFGKIQNVHQEIISPTFVLRRDYEDLIHVDGYRFEKPEEGKSLALDMEIEKSGKIIMIEWPERFTSAINIDPDFIISFKHNNIDKRDIFIKKL